MTVESGAPQNIDVEVLRELSVWQEESVSAKKFMSTGDDRNNSIRVFGPLGHRIRPASWDLHRASSLIAT